MQDQTRILVVDDDPYLRDLLTDTLGALEYQSYSAPDAEKALDRLRKTGIDLIISDIKMPGMDGVEFAKRVKREFPDLPIIFITGVYDNRLNEEKSAFGVLAKPFRIGQVEDMIEKALTRRENTDTKQTVLIIDDDDSFRLMLVEALRLSGYRAQAVAGAQEAFSKIRQGGISIVISDIKMPGTDGLKLTRNIKKNWPDLPVILITGYVPYSENPDLDEQVEGLLLKPFKVQNMTSLLEKIKTVKNQ